MTKSELESKNKSEIAQIAKDMGINRYHGKSMFTKNELISLICLKAEEIDDVAYINKQIAEAGESNKNESISVVKNVEIPKEERILNAKIGELIAFRDPDSGKLNTAKLTNRNKTKRLIKCETKYGREFLISFDDIAWVKTGKRWPKGIYNELKGKKADAGEKVKCKR